MDLQIRWHHIIYAILTSFDLLFNFLLVPQVLIFLFSFIAMLEILKSMWMSKGTTVEQGSKVYRYIVIYSHKTFWSDMLCSCAAYSRRSALLFVHNRYTAALLCMASSIEFVSMTQWIMLAKARELICWIQGSSFLYCDATTCFMEGIQSTVERSLFLFLQKGCVCIYSEACNQILKCPCTVCNTWSDIYTHAHTMTVFYMIYGLVSFCCIKCIAE